MLVGLLSGVLMLVEPLSHLWSAHASGAFASPLECSC